MRSFVGRVPATTQHTIAQAPARNASPSRPHSPVPHRKGRFHAPAPIGYGLNHLATSNVWQRASRKILLIPVSPLPSISFDARAWRSEAGASRSIVASSARTVLVMYFNPLFDTLCSNHVAVAHLSPCSLLPSETAARFIPTVDPFLLVSGYMNHPALCIKHQFLASILHTPCKIVESLTAIHPRSTNLACWHSNYNVQNTLSSLDILLQSSRAVPRKRTERFVASSIIFRLIIG